MLERFDAPVIAAYEGDQPVGMVMYSPLDLAPKPADIHPFDIWTKIPEEEHRGSIIPHCVFIPDEDKHGRGIGDALMNSLITILKQPHPSGGILRESIPSGEWDVQDSRGPSSFYERYGFSVIEELEETCLLMRLDLT